MIIESEIPLHRLVSRKTVDALFDSFLPLAGGRRFALYDWQGALFARSGLDVEPRLPPDILPLLAAAAEKDGEPVRWNESTWYPVFGEGKVAAILEAAEPFPALLALQRSLNFLVISGTEKRQLARETLDRYREVNLLYHVAEIISGKLDVEEILAAILAESLRAIQARGAAAVLWEQPASGGKRATGAGAPAAVQVIITGLESLAEQSGLPSEPTIWENPPGWDGALLYVPMSARNKVFGAIGLLRNSAEARFQSGEEKLLLALSSQAGFAIDKAILYQNEILRQKVEQELHIGERIQRSLLPREMPSIPGWEFASMYQSANQVGGDFFDVYELPHNPQNKPTWGMMVADVTGKGIPAALMMAFSHAILEAATFVHQRPADILAHANQLIVQHSRSGLLLTVFYAILHPESSQLWFANGGHEPPFWYQAADRSCMELDRGVSLLVGARRSTVFLEHSVTLAPGDQLVLFTDGVTEARSPSGEFFTSERLQGIIASCGQASAAELLKIILAEITAFASDRPQADDITLFILKKTGEN